MIYCIVVGFWGWIYYIIFKLIGYGTLLSGYIKENKRFMDVVGDGFHLRNDVVADYIL